MEKWREHEKILKVSFVLVLKGGLKFLESRARYSIFLYITSNSNTVPTLDPKTSMYD